MDDAFDIVMVFPEALKELVTMHKTMEKLVLVVPPLLLLGEVIYQNEVLTPLVVERLDHIACDKPRCAGDYNHLSF